MQAVSVIVMRMIFEEMIGNRAPRAFFDLDAHADFAALDALVIFFVEIVGFDKLQRESERIVAWVFDLLNAALRRHGPAFR